MPLAVGRTSLRYMLKSSGTTKDSFKFSSSQSSSSTSNKSVLFAPLRSLAPSRVKLRKTCTVLLTYLFRSDE